MLEQYRKDADDRNRLGVPPLPLTADQTGELTTLLSQGNNEQTALLTLLADRVEPGVSKAAAVKAAWLEQVAMGDIQVAGFPSEDAVAMLAQMGGGYNVASLIRLLEVPALAQVSAEALKGLTKIYEAFDQVVDLAKTNSAAQEVLKSWAAAEWFTNSPEVPAKISFTAYKVEGEINTDDFSPGNQAQSRADIPVHATFFGKTRFPEGRQAIAEFRSQGQTVAFVGDVVGTGSSRKSAINSVSWLLGEDIPHVPNKRRGGLVLGGTIAPIFYATARDAGVLAIECVDP
jgi:aconitate hydratase 2/2-methylisocitrate dehydratase